MGDWDFDLFGDPLPEGHRGRGRPAHVPTKETRQKCVLLAAVGRGLADIAAALSISEPTLKKHYFREIRDLTAAKLKVEGKLLAGLVREIDKGNVSANKELDKRLRRAEQQDLAARYQRDKPASQPVLGKKAAAKEAAKGVGARLAPRPMPLLN